MESIYKIVDSVNGLLWGKNILVFMLIGAAIYFSFKTKFIQFRLFHKIIKVLFKNEKGKHGISSLETFFLGTACRVGAGNIAGVVAAISVGGPGSIFWMWLVAMLGSATAFIESSLSVIYRKKEKDGSFTGGTPFIIEKRLNMRWLGVIYALASVVCYFGVTQVMSNSITGSITSVYTWGADNKFLNLQNISSIAVAILVAYIIFFSKSKKDSIVDSLNKIVPFMAIIYVVAVIYILVTNLTHIPAMMGNIISQAFGTNMSMFTKIFLLQVLFKDLLFRCTKYAYRGVLHFTWIEKLGIYLIAVANFFGMFLWISEPECPPKNPCNLIL